MRVPRVGARGAGARRAVRDLLGSEPERLPLVSEPELLLLVSELPRRCRRGGGCGGAGGGGRGTCASGTGRRRPGSGADPTAGSTRRFPRLQRRRRPGRLVIGLLARAPVLLPAGAQLVGPDLAAPSDPLADSVSFPLRVGCLHEVPRRPRRRPGSQTQYRKEQGATARNVEEAPGQSVVEVSAGKPLSQQVRPIRPEVRQYPPITPGEGELVRRDVHLASFMRPPRVGARVTGRTL